MQNASTTAGKRLLDYLDVHYYFAADTSANDAAAKALRLRMTRSWWGKHRLPMVFTPVVQ